MGFFDREVRNSLDAMFDLDRDGFLNIKEQGMKYDYLDKLSSEETDDLDLEDLDSDLDSDPDWD